MKRTALIALIMVVALFGVAVYANAATTESGTMNVTASTNAVVQITVPPTLDLGALDPEVPATVATTIEGKSNRNATMSAVVTPGTFTTLTATATSATTSLRGGSIEVDYDVEGMADWDAPDNPAGSIVFTLAQ